SIPRSIDFVRRKWHPTQVRTPSEELHPSGSPGVMHSDFARSPGPSVAGRVVPAPIMIGSPAPRIAADPRPAVVIHPRPLANAIGRPSRVYGGHPCPSIRRIIDPSAVPHQIFRTVDRAADG